MDDQSKRRSVDSLQRLYSIVISLSIASILVAFSDNILSSQGETNRIVKNFSMLIAFIITVIPFYHGANRYLDATYVTQERAAKRYSLMVDFFALFLEAMLFFTLTRFTNSGDLFFLVFLILLLFDIVWTLVTKFTTINSSSLSDRYAKWSIVNLFCIILIVPVFFMDLIQDVRSETGIVLEAESFKYILTTLIIVGRTVLDYYLTWDFYYPNDDKPLDYIEKKKYEPSKTNPVVENLKKQKQKTDINFGNRQKKQTANIKTEEPSSVKEDTKN